ncbi:MAG: hypothetical protein M1828_003161 [Chrysothrix sp. TS-e1954]|nr:MAG: hypothetical protein M1828_003161 [Chrysothrix sp. TS-e1954]
MASYAEEQRQLAIADILNNYEKLTWHSNARNETIPQTRLHFTKLLCGLPTEGPDDPNPPIYTDAVYGDKIPPEIAAQYAPKDAGSSSKGKRKQKDVQRETLGRKQGEGKGRQVEEMEVD